MKWIAGVFMSLILTACTSISDLQKVDKEQYFVLEKDHVVTKVAGLAKVRWVTALKAGKYVAVAQDQDGVYFLGEGSSVILLKDEEGDEYLKTGKVPDAAEKDTNRFPRAANVGGLWIPKPTSSKPPKLFYEIRNSPDRRPDGLTELAIQQSTEGALNYADFATETAFVHALVIVNP